MNVVVQVLCNEHVGHSVAISQCRLQILKAHFYAHNLFHVFVADSELILQFLYPVLVAAVGAILRGRS